MVKVVSPIAYFVVYLNNISGTATRSSSICISFIWFPKDSLAQLFTRMSFSMIFARDQSLAGSWSGWDPEVRFFPRGVSSRLSTRAASEGKGMKFKEEP